MIYSFVFLGERNRKEIVVNLTSKITLPSSSYQIIFLTNKEQSEEQFEQNVRVKTLVFKESVSNEQMFETLVQSEKLGTIVLFKESAKQIDFSDIQRMVSLSQNGAKLVVSKQVGNENFFSKLLSAIKRFFIRICLGIKPFNGEGDVVLLDAVLTETLYELDGKSALLTKVNAWAGVEEKNVTIPVQQKEKTKLEPKKLVSSIVWATILFLMIVGNILIAVLGAKLPFLGLFAYITVEVAVLCALTYTLTRSLFFIKYGNIGYTLKSEVIKNFDNFD